jgi:hypothetical protein
MAPSLLFKDAENPILLQTFFYFSAIPEKPPESPNQATKNLPN